MNDSLSFAYHQMDLAVNVLIRNIVQIQSVADWAAALGYSRSHFCRKFTDKFGENPKRVLRRARFRKICRTIQSDWSATAYKVAMETGIHNEKALHKFLNRNFKVGFTELKDNLKRDAFRSRKYVTKAAEDDIPYMAINLNPLNRSSFPGNISPE